MSPKSGFFLLVFAPLMILLACVSVIVSSFQIQMLSLDSCNFSLFGLKPGHMRQPIWSDDVIMSWKFKKITHLFCKSTWCTGLDLSKQVVESWDRCIISVLGVYTSHNERCINSGQKINFIAQDLVNIYSQEGALLWSKCWAGTPGKSSSGSLPGWPSWFHGVLCAQEGWQVCRNLKSFLNNISMPH